MLFELKIPSFYIFYRNMAEIILQLIRACSNIYLLINLLPSQSMQNLCQQILDLPRR